MCDFSDTNWADSEFAREYLDNAEAYVPFRQEMLKVLGFYYRSFLPGEAPKSVLDLGCGDGILSLTVAGIDENALITLVDGSQEMLDRAAERLRGKRTGILAISSEDTMKIPTTFQIHFPSS